MANTAEHVLLDAVVDAWDRNNTITINLLRAIAKEDLDIRPMAGSPTIAQLFAHLHYVRMIFVVENAPDIPVEMRKEEWRAERDPDRLEQMLIESAKIVRDAVTSRLAMGREMERHFDHPILMF